MTANETFASRVQALRKSWIEWRQVKALASSHEFESQYLLLLTLHGWALQAAAEINAVYGEGLAVDVSPAPDRNDAVAAFNVVVANSYTASFTLSERRRAGASSWFVAVGLGAGGRGSTSVAAGPERRNGQWTRGRLEDLLLSMLGAYERGLSHPDISA
ncbi:MAG: hypothetical protein HYX53_16285 [Chloroflexi bacterium]|nr:hypothetical protein [Chloroflexota bacterium]